MSEKPKSEEKESVKDEKTASDARVDGEQSAEAQPGSPASEAGAEPENHEEPAGVGGQEVGGETAGDGEAAESAARDAEEADDDSQAARDAADGDEAEDEAARIEALEARVRELEKEKEELYNRFLRLQADYDNFRRRTREEKARERLYRAQDLVGDLLPVLDNFKRALATKAEHEESKALKQGMEMVYRQLSEALKKEGVVEIEAEGKPFDPNKHQAVMQVESDEHPSNTVVEVLQAGYELNGRVIRPSMVKVSS